MGQRAWQTSERIDRSGSTAIVSSFIEHRIARAMPLLRNRADGIARAAFVGGPDNITFVAPTLDGPMGPGLFQFDLSIQSSEGPSNALVMKWSTYRPALVAEQQPQTQERVLVNDLAAFNLRYFGRQKSDGDRGWSTDWNSNTALPELVEFRLSANATTAAKSLPIVVELLSRGLALAWLGLAWLSLYQFETSASSPAPPTALSRPSV